MRGKTQTIGTNRHVSAFSFLPGAVRQARLSEAERVRGHAEEAFRPGALDALKERGAPNI
mgnify:CR=1 FL=1|jgi:hypothetical protein